MNKTIFPLEVGKEYLTRYGQRVKIDSIDCGCANFQLGGLTRTVFDHNGLGNLKEARGYDIIDIAPAKLQLEVGKVYLTRAGEKVEIFEKLNVGIQGARGRFLDGERTGQFDSWNFEGGNYWYSKRESKNDLLSEVGPARKTRYINVYPDGKDGHSILWKTKEDADAGRDSSCEATIKIEWTPGEGLPTLPRMLPVEDSSHVAEIGYDPLGSRLVVKYKPSYKAEPGYEGHTWAYNPVSVAQWCRLSTAKSVGTVLHEIRKVPGLKKERVA